MYNNGKVSSSTSNNSSRNVLCKSPNSKKSKCEDNNGYNDEFRNIRPQERSRRTREQEAGAERAQGRQRTKPREAAKTEEGGKDRSRSWSQKTREAGASTEDWNDNDNGELRNYKSDCNNKGCGIETEEGEGGRRASNKRRGKAEGHKNRGDTKLGSYRSDDCRSQKRSEENKESKPLIGEGT